MKNIILNALEELDKVQDKQRIIKLEISNNKDFDYEGEAQRGACFKLDIKK